MFRITIHNEAAMTRFVIEGKLAGPWVEELKKCWQAVLSTEPGRFIQVHLTSVIFVDDLGRELLAAMYRQGASLVANGLMTQAIITEIMKSE